MYCRRCGSQIDDDASFCPKCGASTSPLASVAYSQPADSPAPSERAETNGCAIAGFILAFFMPFIGFILSIIGIVKAKRECHGNGKGLAIAGLVISLLWFIALVGLIVLLVVAAGL